MSVLKNVKVTWVKLAQDRPDMGYDGDSPTWQVTAEVPKSEFDAWRKKKLGGAKANEDGTYSIIFKRKATLFKDGSSKIAPKCVTGNLQPLDPETVGNGSIGNIQYSIYDWEFKKKKGKAADLQALQVTTLVSRGDNNSMEFEVEGEEASDLDELESSTTEDEFDAEDDDNDDEDLY